MSKIEKLKREGFITLKDMLKITKGNDFSGCYVIADKKDNILYIGQSIHVKERLSRHKKTNYKKNIYVKRVFSKKERDKIELQLIKEFNPKKYYNLEEIEKFREWLNQFPLSNNTIEKYCDVMKTFFSFNDKINQRNINIFMKNRQRRFYRQGIINYLKFKGIKNIEVGKVKEKPPKTIKPPMMKDIKNATDNLLKKPTIHDMFILRFLLETGCRINEALNLKPKNIKWEDKTIELKTKGDQTRLILVNDNFLKDLKKYIEYNGILDNEKCFFRDKKNNRSSYNTLRYYLKKYKYEELRKTHNYRRALINKILDVTDGNLFTAQAVIGHRSINTTRRYVSDYQVEKEREKGFKKLWASMNES